MASITTKPAFDMAEASDKEVAEYIEHLHDRVQFLEEELLEAEQTILNLHQDGGHAETSQGESAGDSQVETDIQNISDYVRFLANDLAVDKNELEDIATDIAEVLGDQIETTEDLHTASLALWFILRKHEDMASD